MAELNFDLTPKQVTVSIQDEAYVLKEATGEAACIYRNALLDSTQLGPEGSVTKVVGLANVEPLLVSLCLFRENGAPVLLATVRSWPARVVKSLFEKAKEISDLGEERKEEEAAKNV